MEKYRAIPPGYMTVGELAKKMGITVRTLQFYDRKGLLAPSAESNGGRRLYTGKDMIKLHQILSLKSVGFTLEDIKKRLTSFDTPDDVADALAEHAAAIRRKLDSLTETLTAIEALRAEVLQMQSADYKKYADIIVNLQIKNEFYWLIKHFDDQTLENFRNRFNKDSSRKIIDSITGVLDEVVLLIGKGVTPESEEGQEVAKRFWEILMDFADGDISILSRIAKLIETEGFAGPDGEWKRRQMVAFAFIEPALNAYFTTLNGNPLKGDI